MIAVLPAACSLYCAPGPGESAAWRMVETGCVAAGAVGGRMASSVTVSPARRRSAVWVST